MPNHTRFLSAWRLSGSGLANHQGNGNTRRWERSAATALCTITGFNSPSWKQEELASSTLMKSWGLVCSHVWGLNPWPGAWSTAGEQWETAEPVLNWAPSLWLIPSVFLKMCFTDALSGNKQPRTSNSHVWGWSQGTCIFNLSPIDSVPLQAWESWLQVPVAYALWTLSS